MKQKNFVIVGALTALFAGGVIMQVTLSGQSSRSASVSIGLSDIVPKSVDGWKARDEQLGPTESAQGAVKETLNYDEYVYRIFQRGSARFSVYVAYWAPGRMPTRLIQLHTPDRCWVENGWECTAVAFGEKVRLGDHELMPAQGRVFHPPGSSQAIYVRFWLLVSGENYEFGDRLNLIPNPVRWWGQFIKETVHGYEEHYFIRLTSDRPFEEIWQDPGFQEVLSALAELGLKTER